MAIVNVTPDSFYDGGVNNTEKAWLQKVELALTEGAEIIDIGAVSTRPGAAKVSQQEELERLIPALTSIRKRFPQPVISVDTFRPTVAKVAVSEGAGMINDISGGTWDPEIFGVVARANIPYIAMHIKGKAGEMIANPEYQDVTTEVREFLETQSQLACTAGVRQIIWDPGFGFDKTVEHNYQLMRNLKSLKSAGYPLLVGISRKSMINAILKTKPAEALNGTTVLNTFALLHGADILRVHDVKEAVQAVRLVEMLDPEKVG